jgi:phage FluMu gp28-like protein
MTPQEREEALQLVDELQKGRGQALEGEDIPAPRLSVPKILLPYQARWHRDTSRVRFCVKGRRIGFTWGAWASEAVLEAALAKGGQDQFYMGYNQGMAAEFIGDCATFARWFGAICRDIEVGLESVVVEDEKRDIVTYKIRFASGNKIEALSSMPHNWRGRQGHARVDEAGHHNDLRAVIDGALAYLIWGGRVSIGGTLNGEDNDFTELWREIEAGKLDWSPHVVRFSDAVLQGLYKRICMVTRKVWSPQAEAEFIAEVRSKYPSSDVADQELECIALRGSGAYFSRLLLEKCARETCRVVRWSVKPELVLDPDREEIAQRWIDEHLRPVVEALPLDRRTVAGWDFGRSGDLSVVTVAQELDTALGWETPLRVELRNVPFDCQAVIRDWVMANLPLLHHIKFDARGNGQSHAEAALQAYGPAKVECVMLTAQWYSAQFPRYRQAYEDGVIQSFADEDWIGDHRSVVLVGGWPRVSDARTKGSDGHGRHGDAAVAGVLMWAATRSELVPPAGSTASGGGSQPSGKLRRGRQSTALFGRKTGGARGLRARLPRTVCAAFWGACGRRGGTGAGETPLAASRPFRKRIGGIKGRFA